MIVVVGKFVQLTAMIWSGGERAMPSEQVWVPNIIYDTPNSIVEG